MSSIKQEFRDFMSSFASSGLSDFLPGMMLAPSESGVAVTEMTAVQVAAVAACIRILSSSVGMLPCNVYQRVDGGSNLAPTHALYSMLHDAPNEEYAAVDFWIMMETHRIMLGNCYAEILRDGAGRPAELWIRSPFRTFPYRNQRNSKLIYRTTDTFDGSERVIEPENMVHVKNFGIDPWVGLSPVRYHMREVLGGAIATQNYANRLFGNDARPGGYISAPDVLQPARKLELANNWTAAHSRSGSHTMAILDGGLSWEAVGIQPDEAQFIQTRQMQREDICAMYGVPPHFVGAQNAERSANLEQRFLEFLVTCLKPNLKRYECELNAKLFAGVGRSANKYFVKFDTADFERADFATTLKALQVGRYSGLYTINEGRKMLGLNPIDPKTLDATNPGGSIWQPVNMVPITDGEDEVPTAPPVDTPIMGPDGKPVPPAPSEPGTNADATSDSRAFFPVFFPQMKDGITRLCARNKVDSRDFEKVLTPILAGVASTYAPLSGDMTLPLELAGVIKTHTQAMYDRHTSWDPDINKSTTEELTLALEAIIPTARTFINEENEDE
jgi:HK97 family phage portal protein